MAKDKSAKKKKTTSDGLSHLYQDEQVRFIQKKPSKNYLQKLGGRILAFNRKEKKLLLNTIGTSASHIKGIKKIVEEKFESLQDALDSNLPIIDIQDIQNQIRDIQPGSKTERKIDGIMRPFVDGDTRLLPKYN